MKKAILFFAFCFNVTCLVKAQPIRPLKPLPSDRQMEWSRMEFYLFVHFGPNTFTDLEWGKGTEHEEVFNPTQLDCRQWCRLAKAGCGPQGVW